MDKDKILKLIEQMPNYNEELIEKYNQLILIAINLIEAKKKKNINKYNEIVLKLCAVMVNLWIVLENCSNYPSGSFAGNGYKIKKDAKKECFFAKKLFDHWRSLAANFLVDEGFSFFAIKGAKNKWHLKTKLKKQ